MNLVVDIGNTRLKTGLFEKNRLVEKAFWTDWTFETLSEFAQEKQVERVILSSVAESSPNMTRLFDNVVQFVELSSKTPVPFRNLYQTPETLGKDRIAGVAGAIVQFPDENVLVVDCGTCIKYDFVDKTGAFQGGNIAPGAKMRLRAMNHFTARLPVAKFEMPENPIGQSTETALQNGGLLGAVFEIEGFAQVFAKQFGHEMRLVLTGGDADFFAKHLTIKNLTVEPDLVLIGLNSILHFNATHHLSKG